MFGRFREALGLSERRSSDVEFEKLKLEFDKLDVHFIALYHATDNYLQGVRNMLNKAGHISEVLIAVVSRADVLMRCLSSRQALISGGAETT